MTDYEVWLAVYCAVAACPNSNCKNAERWADSAVAKFRERWPACSRCGGIHRPEEACPLGMQGRRP